MYDFDLVTELCRRIVAERDPEKALELTFTLQKIIRENIQQSRFLAQKYLTVFNELSS
jgi:LytS/YehU family sensor histidine kinase